MALSVSGFPEPSRQNEVFSSEDGQNRATLMNSPRLRGLFGANSSGSSRKATSSKTDSEPDSFQSSPPTTPSLSFSPSLFEPLSQQEYELELQLPMAAPPPTRVHTTKRAQLPPVPRRTAASPVRLGPNLARLDIGAGTRSPPTSHLHPKAFTPPSVVVEEWGSKATEGSSTNLQQAHQPRPLPSVPSSTPEPAKTYPPSNPVAGPSRLANAATSSVAGPSRHANAIAGSSKHVNAVAGSSKAPHTTTTTTSPTAAHPPSKILITQPSSPQRAASHRQNSPSFSLRYQPLVADPSSSSSAEQSSSSSTQVGATGAVSIPAKRPLPRIPPPGGPAQPLAATPHPPAAGKSNNGFIAAPSPSRYVPPPARGKRPKTSPGIMSGFSVANAGSSSSNSTPTPSRSAFENIPSSWASRPVDLNAQRPISPPVSHSRPLPLKASRSRSHSRTPRRDRSLDSLFSRPPPTPSLSTPKVTPTNSPRTTISFGTTRQLRSGPLSPTVTGARPLPRRSPTAENILTQSKRLNIQTSATNTPTSSSATSGTASANSSSTFSPIGGRRLPPSPPTGPVPRHKPVPSSPTIAVAVPTHSRSSSGHLSPTTPTQSQPRSRPSAAGKSTPTASKSLPAITVNTDIIDISDIYENDNTITTGISNRISTATESPLHAHPIEAFADSESLLHPNISPIEISTDSPIEFNVDDQYHHHGEGNADHGFSVRSLSRSPSPIRYARPDSRGNLSDSDLEDELFPSASSSSSTRSSISPSGGGAGGGRRKRTLLRSYRNSYRPHHVVDSDSPPPVPYSAGLAVLSAGVGAGAGMVLESEKEDDREKEREREKEKERKRKEEEEKVQKKKKKETRKTGLSYFGGDSRSGSAPGTRASSPERKSRSRQPRRLAEAVSMALEEVRNRGRGGSNASVGGVGGATTASSGNSALMPPSHTSSSAAPGPADIEMEVLDISMPSLSRRDALGMNETGSTGSLAGSLTGSTNSIPHAVSGPVWAKRNAAEMEEISSSGGSAAGSAAHLNNAVAVADTELDGSETPFMWVSTNKPPVPPAPFIPSPPPNHHRRINSSGRAELVHVQADVSPEFDARHRLLHGLPRSKPHPELAMTTTITSTVSVSRPPASATSTPFSFGIGRASAKNKKQRTASVPVHSTGFKPADPYSVYVERDGPPLPMPMSTTGGLDGNASRNEDDLLDEKGVVVVTTRRIVRNVDEDGDIWEHEQETGVVDVIPQLRNLKASKS